MTAAGDTSEIADSLLLDALDPWRACGMPICRFLLPGRLSQLGEPRCASD